MVIALVSVSILLVISLYFNWRFASILLKLEDALEDCLDTINEKYSKMSEILSRPLFFDSPEVRRVVEDIRETRNSLHRIALSLSDNFKAEEDLQKDVNVRQKEN